MKGAQTDVIPARLLELNKLADEFYNIGGSFDLFFGRIVRIHKNQSLVGTHQRKNPFF
jgi:hypothetical protein